MLNRISQLLKWGVARFSPNGRRLIRPDGLPFVTSQVLMRSGIPFVIAAGDGGSNGLLFAGGGGGAFTMSAPAQSSAGNTLAGFHSFFYLPANAGGAGNAAGWYYGVWASDSSGVIYGDRYLSGNPAAAVPVLPATFPGAPAGRIAQTTGIVTGVTGITLPGGILGPEGELEWKLSVAGDTASVKNIYLMVAGQQVIREQATTSPATEKLFSIGNTGVRNRQVCSAWGRGVGGLGTSPYLASIDTSVDCVISEALQVTTNTGTLVRLSSRLSVINYGD